MDNITKPAEAAAPASGKSAAGQDKKKELPYTAFTDQPARLYCPGYTCTDAGVYTASGRQVCMHPILPVGALCSADTGEMYLLVAFCPDGRWVTRAYPRTALASATGILELAAAGAAVTNENARLLSSYLTRLYHENTDLLPTRLSLSRLGWLTPWDDDFAPYSERIYMDLAGEFAEKARAVHPAGLAEDWTAAVCPLWKNNLTARLALDASFASVLLTPLELQPFFVHLWGKTGLGKTVLLQLAASVWGDPRPGRLITGFNATAVGLETTAAFLRDLPVCIDELQVLAAAGRTDFQQTVYMLAEGVGKTRGAKDGGLRQQHTWRNVFLTTGERPITGEYAGGGAMNRCVELEITAPLTGDFVALTEAVQYNYGWAGFQFTQIVSQRRAVLPELYTGHLKALVARGATGKQAAAMAALLTADDLAGTFIFNSADEPIPYDAAAALLLDENRVSSERRGIDYLFETIAANPAKFPTVPDPKRNYEVWGKPTGAHYAVIGKVFNAIMEEGGFSPRAVLSCADRMGLLEKDGNNLKKLVKINQNTIRCVVIRQPDRAAARESEVTK